jgi:hypothetical protein
MLGTIIKQTKGRTNSQAKICALGRDFLDSDHQTRNYPSDVSRGGLTLKRKNLKSDLQLPGFIRSEAGRKEAVEDQLDQNAPDVATPASSDERSSSVIKPPDPGEGPLRPH